VCRWLASNTPANSRCLTPPRQQTFKWYAERSEVVTWKDVPQDAPGLLVWWERLRQVESIETPLSSSLEDWSHILALARQHGCQYVVTCASGRQSRWPLPRVYENATFQVYQIMPGTDDVGPVDPEAFGSQ
jgi:hypothetical protein